MKDNSFEKQIADKLNRMEVRVPDSLLESVFEARAARRKKSGMYGKIFLAASVAVLSILAVALYIGRSGQEAAPESGHLTAQAPENIEKAGNNVLSEIPESNQTADAEHRDQSSGLASSAAQSTTGSSARKALPFSERQDNKRQTTKVKDKHPAAFEAALANTKQSLKSAGSAKTYGLVNSPDDYFNLASTDRPELAYEEHKGNSHLFVYRTSESLANSDNLLIFCKPAVMKPFEMVYGFEAFSPVAAKSMAYRSLSAGKKPLFLDFMYMPAWNTHGSSGGGESAGVMDGISVSSYNAQFGIRLSVPVKQAFSVFGGLNYRAQANRYRGDIVSYKDETRVDKHVSYINDPVKGVIQVVRYDTVNYTAQNVNEVNYTNTYTMIQLPLGISYNLGYGRYDFACHGSVLLNAFVRSNGQALETQSGSSRAFSSSRPFYGIGGGFGLMAAAKLTPRFRLIAEPGFQFYGINSRKAGNNMSERALSGGISLGLRYTVF